MIILEILGWLLFSCMLMSFIEHQVHLRLMHTKSLKKFQRTYEAHAIEHHGHYSKIFSDEPVPKGEDKEIQLTVRKAPIKALPFAIVMSLFSWYAGFIFIGVVVFHHWAWNKIHLEMHKPENKGFSKWPIYKFLQQYHCLHHKYPLKNLNVVFPFADYVLGTSVRMTAADRIWLDKMLAPATVEAASSERELVTNSRK